MGEATLRYTNTSMAPPCVEAMHLDNVQSHWRFLSRQRRFIAQEARPRWRPASCSISARPRIAGDFDGRYGIARRLDYASELIRRQYQPLGVFYLPG